MNKTAIDVHAHYWTDEYLDLVQALGKDDTGTQRDKGAGPGSELTARLDLMDRAGVGLQVLSTAPQSPYGLDKNKAVAAARFVNDQYSEITQRYPNRFRAFSSLPLPHIPEALEELERALDLPGIVGVATTTTVLGIPITDDRFTGFWKAADARGAVVYIHPAGESAQSPLIANGGMTWMVGAPTEDTISVVNLILGGFASKYPNVKIINSHLGGALPLLLQRIDNLSRWEKPSAPEKPSEEAFRMWYDSVGHGHAPALAAAVASFGAERILFGTDFPYENGALFERAHSYVRDAGLAPSSVEAIYEGNARRLFEGNMWERGGRA